MSRRIGYTVPDGADAADGVRRKTMNAAQQTSELLRASVLATVLLVLAAGDLPSMAQLPPPAPAPATAVQDEASSTNRLVFKKRQRRTYENSVDIRAPEGEQQVPVEEEKTVIQKTPDDSVERAQTRKTDAMAKRSAWSHRLADSQKKSKDNADDENWLTRPDAPLTDVMSILGAISGNDKEKKRESEWGWLADEVIARDPKSALAGKKKTDDGKKTKNQDGTDAVAGNDDTDGEQTGNEPPPGNTFDRKKDRRTGLFADRGEGGFGRDEKDDKFEIGGPRRTKDDDQAPRGYFSRDLMVKDQQETDRENEKAASDDPNRMARASAAEESPDGEAAEEKPAFPMIQSLLSNRGVKPPAESTGAGKTDYAWKTPKPPSASDDAAGKNWSSLGPRAESAIASSYDRDRPVLGTMDTSGRIGGLFGPSQDTAGRNSTYTAPVIAPTVAPAAAPARSAAGPSWPSATAAGGSLWSPGAAAGSRLPGIGSDRSTLPPANNSTMPSTPYARPGGSFSSGFPGGLPK